LQVIKGKIEAVNRDLANDPQLAGSQIKRFLVLHKELDPDDGELTRTRKVRRSFVSEKYDMLVEALYSGTERMHVETEMTFKDGRKGTVAADIDILAAETVETAAPLMKAS
ncbi:MAG: long-chain fatty acid--CoA ligase, partial [Proteobacteria bacterium]|nr:long-chain fatty acid--CoA ligase [Pseudomonadota bacterium]